MYFTKQADGFRAHFVASQGNGSLRTGLLAGDFTVTVVDPADGATLTPAVSESTQKSGMYFFDITSGFITTNGVGDYGVVVEVDTFAGPSSAPHVRDVFGEVLRVTQEDFDTLAVPGDEMDLIADAVDSNSVATSGANEVRDAILSDSTPFAGANIDAAISSRAAPGDAMDLVAGAVDAASIATDAIDADALATSAVNEVRDSILSDSTPFAGANVDAAISSRAVPGDAMDLVANAVDAAAIATDAIDADSIAADAIGASELAASAVTEIQSAILSDATPFAGGDIATILADTAAMQPLVDVAISTRAAPGDAMALTAAAVLSLVDDIWDEDIVATHGTADTAGLLLRALGALISQRANNPNLNALLGVSDAVGADVPSAVDTELSGPHGAGNWEGAGGQDWSSSEREQIRFRLAMDGTQTDPTTGAGTIEDILTDTAAIDTRLPADPADESNQQASHAQTQADIAALNDLNIADVQTALDNQGYTAARAPNLDNLDATVSSRESEADAATRATTNQTEHDSTQADIAALNDIDIADVQTALDNQGYTAGRAPNLDNLNDTVSSRASQSSLDSVSEAVIATDLVAIAGSSTTEIRTGATQADGFYDDMQIVVVNAAGIVARDIDSYLQINGAFTVGTTLPFTPDPGDRVIILNTVAFGQVEVSGIANAVWNALQASYQGAGTMGEQVQKLDLVAMPGPNTVASGSFADRLMNKDANKAYNQLTDALEALRDRQG